MKVGQMRELIESFKVEGQIPQKTVEFVVDAKKFFAEDVKAGTNTMAFSITRENYHPLSLSSLANSLSIASAGLEVEVYQGSKKLTVSSSFMTDSALELVLE